MALINFTTFTKKQVNVQPVSLINLLLYPEGGILRRHSVPRLLLRQFGLAPPLSVLGTCTS